MQNQASRVLLEQARQYFQNHEYKLAKQKLTQLNQHDLSSNLNIILTEWEITNRQNSKETFQKLLNLLTSANIQLYQKNRPKKINFISHELLYWNIIAIAQNMKKTQALQLVGNECLLLYKSFKASTSLKIICEMLKTYLTQNRLSSCFSLLQKYEKIIDRNRKLNSEDIKYKIMVNVMFTRVLIKIHMISEAQALYMLKFGQAERQAFLQEQKNQKKRDQYLNFSEVINFLHAQIEFVNKNYEKSIHLISQNIQQKGCWEKGCAENNLGLILCMNGKYSVAEKLFLSSAGIFYKMINQLKKVNYSTFLYEKVKQNIILCHLLSRSSKDIGTHSYLEYDQKYYTQIGSLSQVHSYKQFYRKAEICLNLYHSLLEKVNRKLPFQEIYDNYDTVYYYPNQPYFQFKGRNKNIYHANKKQVHRRFLINQWNNNREQEMVDKDLNRKKFEKQAYALKLKQILDKGLGFLKKSLMIIEKQKQIVIHIESLEKNKVQSLTEKLYHQYSRFESSILCLLTYISLCRCDWKFVIHFSDQFENKKCFETSAEDHYRILTYKMEAYCELNKPDQSFKIAHEILGNGFSRNQPLICRDGSNLNNCVFENEQNQETNFLFNLAILHSRNNRIAESHQAIQKLFTELNKIPNNPRVNIPLPIIELLIHYNLRINNISSALQLIKRRRILVGAGNSSISKQVLNITK